MRFAICLFSVVVSAFSLAGAAERAARPNVLVILADDQGWGDLSIHGNSNLATPNIDRLARDGAQLENFFVCPLCSPTRAEFLTGRYYPRTGVSGVSTGQERLNLDEKTIADAFRVAGYATACFGKWHNGSQWPYHPNARGFEEYYGFTSGHWGQYFDPELEHNGKIVRGKGFIIDDLTDHAMAFVEKNRERPFFCYVPFNTPHSPFLVPDRFFDKFRNREIRERATDPKQEDLDVTRCALAMCENIDWNVGRLLGRLEELKLAENTIVVYFSDNGPNSWRYNGGMKGRKGSTDEGGVRLPCFIRWPGKIRQGTVIPQIAGAIDLMPTLTALAGVARVGHKPLDGMDLGPLLLGKAQARTDRRIFSTLNKNTSVRTQQYRLDNKGALFDMQADHGQTTDISAKKPQIAAELARAVAAWRKEVVPDSRTDDRPFPVGYREFPSAQLPARDGTASGKAKRSANAPNCSYFTNWTTTDDRLTWDVEVATTGTYEITAYYTCPAKDVGATVELSFGASTLCGKVTEANDPPLITNLDRVPRKGESYLKDFRPMTLGRVRLEKGCGPLALRAIEIPGAQVMDLRRLVVTLVE